MASYSITIANTFNIFGGGRTNRWGDSSPSGTTLVWQSAGVSTFHTLFGAQDDLELKVTKLIGNTMAFATDPMKQVTKQITDSLDMTSTVGKRVTKGIDNTISVATTLVTLTLGDGIWSRIYAPDTTNLMSHVTTTYSSVTATTTSWTEQTYTTTTWSET